MNRQNTATAFWVREPGRGELREVPLPSVGPDEVRVRALWSGISRGTESLVFRGEVPPELYESMRAPFQEGDFPGPVKYGYASVGRIEEIGREVDGVAVGTDVLCLHPHQDRYVVPAESVTPLPDGVPSGRAVLGPNLETALNAVWDGGVGPGDRVGVVGGGVVGLLVARIAVRIPGTEVVVVDPEPARREVARALDVGWVAAPPDAFDADVVVHASGHPGGARSALAMAGVEATVVEASWFGTTEVPLPLGGAFHPRRIRIRSSQVGRIPPERAPRWDHARRMRTALSLARDPALDSLLTGVVDLADLPGAMAAIAEGDPAVLCHRVHYPDAGEGSRTGAGG